MTPHLDTIEAIAKAAEDVPMSARGAIAHYEGTMSPELALALVAEIRQLRVALKEACDLAYTTEGREDDMRKHNAAVAELRKLVEP